MGASGGRILQRFEARLEGAVEGFFARAFRSGLQPIELAKGIQRYADGNRDVTIDGIVVPNEYAFDCNAKDHARLGGYGQALLDELAEVVTASAADNGWHLRGPVTVELSVAEGVSIGTFRVRGRVATAVPVAPTASARPDQAAAAPATAASAGSTPAAPPKPSAPGPPAGAPAPPAAAEARTATAVRVDSGPTAGTVVPLRGVRLVCGRTPDSNIVIDDATVSRAHAAFVRRGDGWWVLDLGSTNGTRVNGRAAAEHPVQIGDLVQFGEARVAIVEG